MTAFSYAHGVSPTPLLPQTLGECLAHAAREWPECDAVVACQQGARLTYAELEAAASRAAGGLLAMNVQPGERIALWGAPRAEWLIAQHAIAKTGAILVSLNPAYRAQELECAMNEAGVSVLFAGPRSGSDDGRGTLRDILSPAERARGSGEGRVPSLRTVIRLDEPRLPGETSFDDLLAAGARIKSDDVHRREAMIGIDDPALILFTSGTTGRPKGVVLSHHAVVNGGFFVGVRLRYTSVDRICLSLPLYHVLGCVAANVAALTHGSALVLPSDVFDPRRCLDAIDRERCTAIYGVPTMFIALLEHPEFSEYSLHSLRTGVISGAVCPPDVMRRVIHDMHVSEITVGYGMTEMAPILYTAVDDVIADRVDTAGTVQPHVEVKIVDPSTGHVQPRGVPGELCARGYCAMSGYWNDPSATRAVVDSNGWVRTGDLAVMRADGYVSIAGRVKDIIIRGGENVSPREIENVLHAHVKVRDAHVVSVPDREYGEEICACVRLRQGVEASAEEIRRHCRMHLAAHKIPRYVRFVSEFPTTPSGKVQSFRLREMAIADLGLDATHRH